MISLQNIHDNFVPVRLEFLSPVHIGSGEMLSPLEYQAVEEQSGRYYVYTIDFDGWINSLTPDKSKAVAAEFSVSTQNKIWQFLRNEIDKDIFIKTKSKASKDIYDKYLKRLSAQTGSGKAYSLKNQSKNELAAALRNAHTSAMIIPGSSIKGAIRTAIIDYRDDKGELKQAYDKKLEEWFGKIPENAFKQLKVSDFELLPDESEFVQPVQYNQKDPEERLMNPICEVAPVSTKPKYGKLYLGNFAADTEAKVPLPEWTFENLCKVCNKFYLKRFQDEYNKFYTLPHFVQAKKFIDENIRNKLHTENALLLRVGHYSHVECVTVENSAPKTRPNPRTRKPMPFGTTRTLANGIYPFGWILLHKCSVEDMEQEKKQEEQAKQQFFADLQARKENFIHKKQADYAKQQKDLLEQQKKAEEELRKAQEIILQKQAEEEQKKAEQAQKEAEKLARKQEAQAKKEAEEQRLASLSPEERLVELVLLEKASREEVLKVYDRIDTLENKIEVAEAIKKLWQKEKIWSGKLKGNQKIRVDKITAILRTK